MHMILINCKFIKHFYGVIFLGFGVKTTPFYTVYHFFIFVCLGFRYLLVSQGYHSQQSIYHAQVIPIFTPYKGEV